MKFKFSFFFFFLALLSIVSTISALRTYSKLGEGSAVAAIKKKKTKNEKTGSLLLAKRNGYVTSARGGSAKGEGDMKSQNTKTIRQKVGAFALWVAPVIIYVLGLKVTKDIAVDIDNHVKYGTPLPVIWSGFNNKQLGNLMTHLCLAVPSLFLYHTTSLFLLPGRRLFGEMGRKAAALCNMVSVPMFTISMISSFLSLHKVSGEGAVANLVTSVILILITIPCLPWLLWTIEYSGRQLTGKPNKPFLPKPILWFNSNVINIWKYAQFVNMNKNLYRKKLRNVLPKSWCDVGLNTVQSLVDAGTYACPQTAITGDNNDAPSLLTKQGLEDIQMGLLFNMLYGVLTGINLLSFQTHFGFPDYIPQFLRDLFSLPGSCPYNTIQGTNPGIEMVKFLTQLVIAFVIATTWGLAILASYQVYDTTDPDFYEKSNNYVGRILGPQFLALPFIVVAVSLIWDPVCIFCITSFFSSSKCLVT